MAWKVLPYWENGELVINSTNAGSGQYIAWRYSPTSNVINITIHIASFPVANNNPGIEIFSANPSTAYDWQTGNYYWLAIQWGGSFQYSTPTSGVEGGGLGVPNLMGKVFTETVILKKGNGGNIVISQIYINGTLYSPNISVPFPWNQIYWIGIRGDSGNLFYVSYFGVSPSPYGDTEQFVNNVESTSWKVLPYWQYALVLNTSSTSQSIISVIVTNSQPIATPAPFDQFLNITESQIASALGSSLASQLWQQAISDHFLNLLFTQNGQPLYAWVQNYTSSWVAVWVKLPNGIPASTSVVIDINFTNSIQYPYTGIYSAVYPGYDNGKDVFIQYGYFGNQLPSGWTTGVYAGSFSPKPTANGLEMTNNTNAEGTYVYASLPNTNDYAIITSWWYNGSADALVQELYGNVSKVIGVGGTDGTPSGATPAASMGTLVQNEFWNGRAYIKNAINYKNTSFDGEGIHYVTTYFAIQGDIQYYGYSNHNSPFQITLPQSFVYSNLTTDRIEPTVFIGAGTGGFPSYIYLDVVIVIPTPPNNVMPSITDVTGDADSGQYIAWRYSPTSNVINITIHIASFPVANNNPGIEIFSPNVGDKATDANTGSYVLVVDFHGGSIYFYSPTFGWKSLYSSLVQPNPGYPFTFSVILVNNSVGNIMVQSVYINGTAYTLNINTPFPWSQIGYVGIRGDIDDIFYVSYFGISPFQYGVVKYTINSVSLPSMPDTSSATVLISRLSNGSYAILGVYNGTWHELNLPFNNSNGKFTITSNPVGPVNITVKSSNVLSYGALFSPGNGVLLEAQNAIPPSNPTTYEPLGYVGTNGEVGGGADYYTPQFTSATLNSINHYQGATIATTDWGTTNFTYYAVSVGQNPSPSQNYVVVGLGFTTNWASAPSGYYPFQNGFIDIAYIENNSVATSQTPPNVSSLLFFFDPTYIDQQGLYINPFTNQTLQLSGSLTRAVSDLGVITFLDPKFTNPVIYVPPFTEVIVRGSNYSQAFINYDTFPYQTVTLAPGNYQIAVILLYTAYSFVLINFQGWNVTIYQNGQPMIVNDPITQQIQPFDTQGLLSAQVVANPNTKVLTIYLQPLSSGVGSYSPEEVTFPKPAPQLILPLLSLIHI